MPPRSLEHRELTEIYSAIEIYYTEKVLQFGATPRGVDWESGITQEVRFVQLLRICDFSESFSLNDVGCGYGALSSYLSKYHADTDIDYLGFDLSSDMVRRAAANRPGRSSIEFVVSHVSPRTADYSVASGIFNVKLDQATERWEAFVGKTLDDMRETSRRGFAVNFMAPRANGQPTNAGLYATLPGPWIRHCEHELGSTVELLGDYGLCEFTLLVRPR